MAPSPVLWAKPGDRVRLTVHNQLGPNMPSIHDATKVGFRQANTTNLHLHGIYDDAVHDDTFTPVHPGESKTYEYTLHPASGTSLIFYHPHAAGSTSLQSFGGMGGVLVVEDAQQEAGLRLPPLAGTRILFLQAFDLVAASKDYISTQLSNEGTSAMETAVSNPQSFVGHMLLANGRLAQTEFVAAGSWLRLKIVNGITAAVSNVHLGFWHEERTSHGDGDSNGREGKDGLDDSLCFIAVLAYDGVWLHSPRIESSFLLPPGGRADVLVGCSRYPFACACRTHMVHETLRKYSWAAHTRTYSRVSPRL